MEVLGLAVGGPYRASPKAHRAGTVVWLGASFAVCVCGGCGKIRLGTRLLSWGAPRETLLIPVSLTLTHPTCGQRQRRVSCLGTCGQARIPFLHCLSWPSLDQALCRA